MKKNLLARRNLSVFYFLPLVSLLNLFLYHQPLWLYITSQTSTPGLGTWTALFSLLFMVNQLVLLSLSIVSIRLSQYFSYLTLLGNALALYFLEQFGVILDSDMMGNIFNTRAIEAVDFLSFTLLVYLLIYAIIPIALVSRFKPIAPRRFTLILHFFMWLLLGLGGIYSGSSGWLWIDQHAKQLGARLLPWSYVVNSARHQLSQRHEQQQLLADVTTQTSNNPLIVLVIGETARSANFSLYGYQRNTNPALSQRGAIALKGAVACTTYTTGSLKCILGHSPDTLFSTLYEPLPSYLQRHGVEVIWRTNNWGEPPIKVKQYQQASELRKLCSTLNCDGDAALLAGLNDRINAAQQDKLLFVLHQKGSHGPRYYQRYPKSFERFTPVCRSVELSSCDPQSLLNAYDNSLLYTDYLLGNLIDQLRTYSERPVLMMYLSDHGESLGEYGLYLHGTPYTVAPSFQKKIPFVLWMNQKFIDDHQLDLNSLKERTEHTQYQVFHSLLNAFGMESEIYDSSLDIFAKPSKN